MIRVLEIRNWDLMRAPGPLDRLTVDEFRSGPALGGAKDDHGPARTLLVLGLAACAGDALDPANPCRNRIKFAGERLMRDRRIVALDEMRIVAVTAQQLLQLLTGDARQ